MTDMTGMTGMAVFDAGKIYNDNLSMNENIRNLKRTVRQNNIEIEKIESEIKKLSKEDSVKEEESSIQVVNNKIEVPTLKEKINRVDVSLQLDLLNYASSLDDLFVFMPNKDDKDYENILNTMLFALRRKMLLAASFEDKKHIEDMQNLIYDYMELEEEIDLETEKIEQPTLLYTKTPAGNVCLLNDLKGINSEAYPEFLTLYESIISGNLRMPKTIDHSEGKFKNTFLQVRLNHSRMTFHVLKRNFIVLSGAFVKHVQKSRILSEKFKTIDTTFSNQKDYLLEHLEDPTFLNEQQQITHEVYKVLRKDK